MAGETLLPSIPGQTDATIAAKYYQENTGSDAGLSDQPPLGLGQSLQNKKETKAWKQCSCF